MTRHVAFQVMLAQTLHESMGVTQCRTHKTTSETPLSLGVGSETSPLRPAPQEISGRALQLAKHHAFLPDSIQSFTDEDHDLCSSLKARLNLLLCEVDCSPATAQGQLVKKAFVGLPKSPGLSLHLPRTAVSGIGAERYGHQLDGIRWQWREVSRRLLWHRDGCCLLLRRRFMG